MPEATHPRAVIVTGAARGIGAGIARHLASTGWQVACADLDGEAAAQVAGEIGGIAVQCDVGQEADIERLVAVVRSRLGRIDAIVSNAGLAKFAPLAETTLEMWNQVLATNLTATFLLAKAAARDLERAHGAIVTIASTRAHMSEPGTLAYSASKGGVVALTHALALTLAPRCASTASRRAGSIPASMGRSSRPTMRSIRRGASAGRRTSPPRSPTCCRTRRGSSPAPNWWSTAA